MTDRPPDLDKLRTQGASPAELTDIHRLGDAIYQKQLEVSRLRDRRRVLVDRVRMRFYARNKRAK